MMIETRPIIMKNPGWYTGIIKVKIIPPIKAKFFAVDNYMFEKKENDIYETEGFFC
jgi:hypothetical protein